MFDCDDVGELKEYVGCKLEWNTERRAIKFTQPVLIQSFEDEFNLPNGKFKTPAELGKVLEKCEDGQEVSDKEQSQYRSAVGKVLHMMRWSRPETWNAVRECSRRMSKASSDHMKAVLRLMKYCVDTKERGWELRPSRTWDGKDKSFLFKIRGKSDSNYATCKETRRSVTGYIVWLEDSLIAVKSGMQKIVALSVTEAEVIALVQCVQEMMYMKKIMESLELNVELPMTVEVDNQGAVDLVNGWSSSGGTKHMDVRIMWLRELKVKKIIQVQWQPTKENEADVLRDADLLDEDLATGGRVGLLKGGGVLKELLKNFLESKENLSWDEELLKNAVPSEIDYSSPTLQMNLAVALGVNNPQQCAIVFNR